MGKCYVFGCEGVGYSKKFERTGAGEAEGWIGRRRSRKGEDSGRAGSYHSEELELGSCQSFSSWPKLDGRKLGGVEGSLDEHDAHTSLRGGRNKPKVRRPAVMLCLKRRRRAVVGRRLGHLLSERWVEVWVCCVGLAAIHSGR